MAWRSLLQYLLQHLLQRLKGILKHCTAQGLVKHLRLDVNDVHWGTMFTASYACKQAMLQLCSHASSTATLRNVTSATFVELIQHNACSRSQMIRIMQVTSDGMQVMGDGKSHRPEGGDICRM